MKQKTKTETAAQPSTQCQQGSFQFQAHGAREVVADFTGGQLSSDGDTHTWRNWREYPCEIQDPKGWGNFVAFHPRVNLERVNMYVARFAVPANQ